jgi:hypothetical protein
VTRRLPIARRSNRHDLFLSLQPPQEALLNVVSLQEDYRIKKISFRERVT